MSGLFFTAVGHESVPACGGRDEDEKTGGGVVVPKKGLAHPDLTTLLVVCLFHKTVLCEQTAQSYP